MEQNCTRLTERILHLTLEIIYLLTGEDNILVKKTLGDGQDPIMVPLQPPLIPDRNNDKKILKTTNKIIELLTREVPIRCQDVSVYLSMEEWEYLEGNKDLYKDHIMEDHQPLPSPDGSTKPSERSPGPLCHRDSIQEDLEISHHNQSGTDNPSNDVIRKEIKKEEEESEMEEWEYLEGHETTRNPPENCPLASTQEDDDCGHHDQEEEVIDMKIEVKEEEKTYARGDQLSIKKTDMRLTITKEESVLDIRTGGDDGWNTTEGHLILSPDCNEEDSSMAQHSPVASLVNERPRTRKSPFLCSECGKGFTQKRSLIMHQRTHTNERPFPCQDCGKCFKVKFCLDRHAELHENKASLSCPECGKSFEKRSELHVHQRGHSGKEIFSCPDCEKSFIRKYDLIVHQRTHTGEPPFSCSDCKKSFKNKRELVRHQRIHTGEKPFSCSVCGKSFTQKSQLNTHQIVHTGEKPFSCSECGKGFPSKGNRDKHMRIHTGEKPFSCSDCGKCFAQKVTLIIHQRTHTACSVNQTTNTA